MMTTARWHDKATSYATAHQQVMGAFPSKHHVELALSVAQHESGCGDELAGNWGATTVEGLSSADAAALKAAGISPDIAADLPRAQALLGARHGLVLWRDYSKASGWYFTWFFKPANDVDGAAYFVKVLVQRRPGCAAVLNNPAGTTKQLAAGMYATSYFLGTRAHDHGGPGDAQNIAEYEHGLDLVEPAIVTALADWVVPGGDTGDAAAGVTSDPLTAGPGWENNEDNAPPAA
jgi:hypothetical protein